EGGGPMEDGAPAGAVARGRWPGGGGPGAVARGRWPGGGGPGAVARGRWPGGGGPGAAAAGGGRLWLIGLHPHVPQLRRGIHDFPPACRSKTLSMELDYEPPA